MTDLSARIHTTAPTWARRAILDRAEIILITLLVFVALLCVSVSAIKSQAVAWGAFGTGLISCLGLMVVGLYIRIRKNLPNLAHLAIGNGLYLGFTATVTILIYLRFPVHGTLLDDKLVLLDAKLGFFWPDFVLYVANYPEIAKILRVIYQSSLVQLFALVAFLALSSRILQLHRALLAGSISLLLTTMIWWVAPSIGPAAFYEIPLETAQSINLFTDMEYGAFLRQLVEHGLPVIAPEHIVGTIAFPSYHTVMAWLVVWYLRGSKLFWPALLINLAMVPAILVHGGHYLTDVIGGTLTFAVAAVLAKALTEASDKTA